MYNGLWLLAIRKFPRRQSFTVIRRKDVHHCSLAGNAPTGAHNTTDLQVEEENVLLLKILRDYKGKILWLSPRNLVRYAAISEATALQSFTFLSRIF